MAAISSRRPLRTSCRSARSSARPSPLGDDSPVLPGGESASDLRFVVRYFRRVKTGELLFGGREIYAVDDPKDIHIHIRRQISEIYPS